MQSKSGTTKLAIPMPDRSPSPRAGVANHVKEKSCSDPDLRPEFTRRLGGGCVARKSPANRRARRRSGSIRVKVLPKDPLVARTQGLWPVDAVLECRTAGDGPTSARVAIVDYNGDLDTRFAPAKLLKDGSGFRGIAALKHDRILDNFNFHQVNVWAIIEQILTLLEDDEALGRPVPWASRLGRLLVLPHAGYQDNAFYDRATGALHLFYFEGPDGSPVYTCLSHDIVAHELGHAVLDGLKPGYNEVCSPETAGFHEYFGDAIAMLASLNNREIAKLVTKGAPAQLTAKNVVSAIASEFGAAIHGLPGQDYLRGAWNKRKMSDLRGTYEEHDWSEILTGVYYDLLQYLYVCNLKELSRGSGGKKRDQQQAIRALFRAANQTANVMLRAIDYCPPVDLRYDEYARALLRADEVAYPGDTYGIRAELKRIFRERGLQPPQEDQRARGEILYALRSAKDIDAITATPADAYRFLDEFRGLFQIPFDANLSVVSVYRTKKRARSGYWAPKERVIEFTWSEDVKLEGRSFGAIAGTLLPLYCGGTLVFDGNGNFLHMVLVPPTEERRKSLLKYARHLVRSGSLGVTDGSRGIGAPAADNFRIRATIEGTRVRFERNAAMRHARADTQHHAGPSS
jgi:hypothetical protein